MSLREIWAPSGLRGTEFSEIIASCDLVTLSVNVARGHSGSQDSLVQTGSQMLYSVKQAFAPVPSAPVTVILAPKHLLPFMKNLPETAQLG